MLPPSDPERHDMKFPIDVASESMYEKGTWRPKRRRCLHDILVKEWPDFSTEPNCREGQNAIDTIRGAGGVGDDLRIFFQDSEDCVLSSAVEEIGEFCQGAQLDSLSPCATQRRAAWLDDRSFQLQDGSRCARTYKNPLTANALYELLSEPVNMSMSLSR
jgi:hypothetical protein